MTTTNTAGSTTLRKALIVNLPLVNGLRIYVFEMRRKFVSEGAANYFAGRCYEDIVAALPEGIHLEFGDVVMYILNNGTIVQGLTIEPDHNDMVIGTRIPTKVQKDHFYLYPAEDVKEK